MCGQRIGISLLFFIWILSFEEIGARTHTACHNCTCTMNSCVVTVDCRSKLLYDVPNCSQFPSNTTNLLLSKNSITEIRSNAFTCFENLIHLNLFDNHVWYIDPKAFYNLNNLVSLDLQKNSLTYNETHFTDQTFSSLSSLRWLKINDNNNVDDRYDKNYPGWSLRNVPSLRHLYVDGLENRTFDRNFTFLTTLTNITIISDYRYCNMRYVNHETFQNLPYLQFLQIIKCSLHYIQPGSFSHLRYIKLLNLSDNIDLGFQGATNATTGISQSLEILYLDRIVNIVYKALCVIIDANFTRNIHNTSLTYLSANDNLVEGFTVDAIGFFPQSLRHVYFRGHSFKFGSYVWRVGSLTGLKTLDLTGKDYKNMGYLSSLHSPSDKFELGRATINACNNSEYIFDCKTTNVSASAFINVPPNLTNLVFSHAQKYFHIRHVHIVKNRIVTVDVSCNLITEWYGPVDNMQYVKNINLSYNLAHCVAKDFFHSFPNLEQLDISNNLLGEVLCKSNQNIFTRLTKLTHLNLSSNEILTLPRDLFSDLISLQILILENNGIWNVTFSINHLYNLHRLSLSNNHIKYFSSVVRSALDGLAKNRSRPIDINLFNNQIACTCFDIEFLSWMERSNSSRLINFTNFRDYYCVDAQDQRRRMRDLVDVIQHLQDTCRNYFGLYIGVASVMLILLSIMIMSTMYRFRWKLRYFYYAARLKYSNQPQTSNDLFAFDAFISYAEEDREFVLNHLVVNLEDVFGLTLNLHHNTFTPGRPIVQSIIQAIQTSRRTLVILSKSFLESYWCLYELQMAHMESITTGRDVLLIVMLEQLPTRLIPSEIIYHIQTDCYIEYPPAEERDTFWRRLAHSVNA